MLVFYSKMDNDKYIKCIYNTTMTKQEFVDWLKADVTISGALPLPLPDAEYVRIADKELKTMYEINSEATEQCYCIIDRNFFYTPEFRRNRIIQFPDCVFAVTEFYEMKRKGNVFGIADPDFAFNKTFMTDMWFGGMMNMDSVAFRTVQASAWDQMKQFTLVNIQHHWNHNKHQLFVKGHDPRVNVYCGLYTKIDAQDLYDNIWVQKWVSAHCKLQANKLLTTAQTNLIGGVQINMSAYVDEANKDIEECQKRFLENAKVPRMYTV